VETGAAAGELEALVTALQASAREVTKLRCEVHGVPVGTLANDGKVIEDARSLD
jgi:phenylacetate-CoA ligase